MVKEKLGVDNREKEMEKKRREERVLWVGTSVWCELWSERGVSINMVRKEIGQKM